MEIKCGANGDAFTFDLEVNDSYENNGKVILVCESDGLNDYLQQLADIMGVSKEESFDPKTAELYMGESKWLELQYETK